MQQKLVVWWQRPLLQLEFNSTPNSSKVHRTTLLPVFIFLRHAQTTTSKSSRLTENHFLPYNLPLLSLLYNQYSNVILRIKSSIVSEWISLIHQRNYLTNCLAIHELFRMAKAPTCIGIPRHKATLIMLLLIYAQKNLSWGCSYALVAA